MKPALLELRNTTNPIEAPHTTEQPATGEIVHFNPWRLQ